MASFMRIGLTLRKPSVARKPTAGPDRKVRNSFTRRPGDGARGTRVARFDAQSPPRIKRQASVISAIIKP
jgi:hypothetical protein